MGKLFGTDGIRGVANEKITPELAFKLGQSCAIRLQKLFNKKVKICIGKDTRISGDMLENALAAGICSVGGDAEILGILPTPAVAYLIREHKADAGVVISASHNSFEYNGLKVFNQNGYKLDDQIEAEIEEMILSDESPEPVKNENIGRVLRDEEALKEYTAFLLEDVDFRLDGMKLVVDTANGASYKAAKAVFGQLGCETVFIGDNPDGININNGCGSTHLEALQERVLKEKADIGLAYDGDADRFLAVDGNGQIVNGDVIMGICAVYLKNRGKLKGNTLVGTVMSNIGLKYYLDSQNINFEATSVGDRYVLERMLEKDYSIGGEQSGHVIILEKNSTGDGMATSLLLLRVIRETGRSLADMATDIEILPQVLVNVRVHDDVAKTYMNAPSYKEALEEADRRVETQGRGRILIRASGTEPLVRVMLEGEDQNAINEIANDLANVIKNL